MRGPIVYGLVSGYRRRLSGSGLRKVQRSGFGPGVTFSISCESIPKSVGLAVRPLSAWILTTRAGLAPSIWVAMSGSGPLRLGCHIPMIQPMVVRTRLALVPACSAAGHGPTCLPAPTRRAVASSTQHWRMSTLGFAARDNIFTRQRSMQYAPLGGVRTQWIRIVIEETYPAPSQEEDGSDFTPISEVQVHGT